MKHKYDLGDFIGALFVIYGFVSWVVCWVKMFGDLATEHWNYFAIHALGAFLVLPSLVSVWFYEAQPIPHVPGAWHQRPRGTGGDKRMGEWEARKQGEGPGNGSEADSIQRKITCDSRHSSRLCF